MSLDGAGRVGLLVIASLALPMPAAADAWGSVTVEQVDVTAAVAKVTQVEQLQTRRSLELVQSGEAQSALLVTSSFGGRIAVDQSGAAQNTEVRQSGAFALTVVRQSGVGDLASVRQDAPWAWAKIVQSGSGNVATVVQGAPRG